MCSWTNWLIGLFKRLKMQRALHDCVSMSLMKYIGCGWELMLMCLCEKKNWENSLASRESSLPRCDLLKDNYFSPCYFGTYCLMDGWHNLEYNIMLVLKIGIYLCQSIESLSLVVHSYFLTHFSFLSVQSNIINICSFLILNSEEEQGIVLKLFLQVSL